MIVIPTYQRYHIKTVELLERECITDFTIYVANQDEYDKYRENYPIYPIIIGVKGISAQRKFIQSQYPEETILLSMDDDIEDFKHTRGLTMKEWVKECEDYLSQSPYGLITFNPSSNPFFSLREWKFKEGRYLCCGMVHMFKVRHDFNSEFLSVEDYDIGMQYLHKYGKVIRCGEICFKTKYWADGGCSEQRTKQSYLSTVNKLLHKYPNDLTYNIKKSGKMKGLPNITIRKKPITIDVIQLPPFDMSNVFDMCKKILFRKRADNSNSNRNGFPVYRGAIFGMVRGRFNGITQLSMETKKHPELYDELVRIGKIICPFEFNKIQLNHNLTCPPHKDSHNQTQSILISFGDYVGGKLIIDKKTYSAFNTPTIFDGSKLEHYNEPHIGDKYSIIYFS